MRSMFVPNVVMAIATAVVVALSMSSTLGAAQAAAKADITGTWVFDVQTDAGPGTPTVTFKQDGEKLTGHYSSATLGEADLTGTVKGQAVAFSFTAEVQGFQVPVAYSATLDSKDSMKGTISITGVGGGTFTGKRK